MPAWLSKLKQIGIDLSNLKGISLFKLSLKIDKSVHIDAQNSIVVVNPDRLNGKQRRGLAQAVSTTGLDEAQAIIDEASIPELEKIRGELPAIQQATEAFVPLIPPSDVPLLQACLYLRQRYKQGEAVQDLKAQIVSVYGARGRNFANLCSAGYLEDWFAPLYDELQRVHSDDLAKAREKFLIVYNSVLGELPWTEFVNQRISKPKLISSVVAKMQRNLQNGVRFLNLHGLGTKNVTKVLSILPELKQHIGAEAVKIEKDRIRIFVRLEIPQP